MITLGRDGYVIPHNNQFTRQFIQTNIIKPLTIEPINNGYAPARSFYVYTLNPKTKDIHIPRYFGTSTIGKPDKEIFTYNKPNQSIKFTGTLKPLQQKVIASTINTLNTIGGGIISLPCGFGKTVCALKIISILKRPTIIIVNRNELIHQWTREAKQFVPEARIGKIQGEHIYTEDKDIVIAMINTVSMKKFHPTFFHKYDLLIVDECHTVGSEIFSQCLPRIQTPWTLGLSATPDRADGCFHVLEKFLGPIHFKHQEKTNPDWLPVKVLRIQPDIPPNSQYTKEIKIESTDKPNIAKMINNIAYNQQRTKAITSTLKTIATNHPTRHILLLADRKHLLQQINRQLPEISALYTGDNTSLELAQAKKKQIILGTFSICGTGFNLPSLNTLILATPKKNIEQAIGRILRQKHEINPLVIDIIDDFSLFKFMAYSRNHYYRQNNFKRIISLDEI